MECVAYPYRCYCFTVTQDILKYVLSGNLPPDRISRPIVKSPRKAPSRLTNVIMEIRSVGRPSSRVIVERNSEFFLVQ